MKKIEEPKSIGKCPTCNRSIERGDDVLEFGGKVYHDGCEPEPVESEPVEPEPIEEAAPIAAAPLTSEQMIERLLLVVSNLAGEVAALKAAKPVATAAAKKPKSEKGQPRPNTYYVVKGYPTEKFAPQCLMVMKAIAQASPVDGKMTEIDIWNALMAEQFPSTKPKVANWNYKQTPYYAFKYYFQPLADGSYVSGPFNLI